MKKVLASFIFLFSLSILIHTGTASASSESKLELDEMMVELNAISDEYDIELDLNPSEITIEKEFDSVEEFQKYLEERKDVLELPSELQETELLEDMVVVPMASGYHSVRWWSPITGPFRTLFSFKNLGFNYNYSKQKGTNTVTSLSNIKSWQTGISDVRWTQTGRSYTKRGTKEVGVTVHGKYTLGVVIGGQPIGFSWNGSWSRHIKLPI